jgi:hypothetical protein
LPNHVKKYLEDVGVDESELSPEALEMLSTLSGGEIALLRKMGESLDPSKGLMSAEVIAKVH